MRNSWLELRGIMSRACPSRARSNGHDGLWMVTKGHRPKVKPGRLPRASAKLLEGSADLS